MSEKRRDNKGRILKENEFQQADGRYFYCYYDFSGKRCREYSWKLVSTDSVPKGKRDDISLREKIAKILEDKVTGVDSSKSKSTTLNDMFDVYLQNRQLKDSTRVNYIYLYNHFVRDVLGKKKLSSIKYSDIISYYNSLINEKGFKPNSMANIHTILHPIFSIGIKDGIINRNPTDGALNEIKKSHSWEKPKRHALTIEQQNAFIEYTKNSPSYSYLLPLFTIFLGTGCRVAELIGLRWQDCDFRNRTISINHNLIYRQTDNGKCIFQITTPKTESGKRIIPMLNEVYSALIELRKYQMKNGFCTVEVDGYSGFALINKDKGLFLPHTINRFIRRIYTEYNTEERKKAKAEHREPIIIPHFSCHHLRHTFATRFCENETNIKVIQEIMGHSDISTTMNIYAEATEQKKKEVFSNLEGKMKIS